MKRFFAVAAVMVVGCSAVRMHGGTLRSRASFDMHCPAEQLQVVEIDGHTAGVDGCSQSGTYIWDGHNDTWVLNSN